MSPVNYQLLQNGKCVKTVGLDFSRNNEHDGATIGILINHFPVIN